MSTIQRIKKVVNWLIYTEFAENERDLAEKLGYTKSSFSQIINGKVPLSEKFVKKLCSVDKNINEVWISVGKGVMLKNDENAKLSQSKNLIPFYDEVSSIGGNKNRVADVSPISTPTDYIDTGDWFKEATAAIRHYGESMPQYPPGCILALKEVKDRSLVIPGRDYVIETSEYRVTKRLQRGETKDHITVYSTNTDTYPDGRLMHEPFDIPWKSITHILLVLGYVVKTNGGTMVYDNNK